MSECLTIFSALWTGLLSGLDSITIVSGFTAKSFLIICFAMGIVIRLFIPRSDKI